MYTVNIDGVSKETARAALTKVFFEVDVDAWLGKVDVVPFNFLDIFVRFVTPRLHGPFA